MTPTTPSAKKRRKVSKAQKLVYVQQMRFSREQYTGLNKAAKLFRVTGRAEAERQINALFMAYFGLIDDKVSAATMAAMIQEHNRKPQEG